MPEPAFKRFGKYEIQAELGRGGFGTVFRAFDPTVGRLVAIKVLTSEAGKDLLTRFRNEAMAAGNLRHENIVTIYEFGDEKSVPFIAMEYMEGEDLQQALASAKPLTLLDKISIMTQAAAGLDCAHRHGVVHRDVKPANIRLLPDGRVKIMDFGIARLIRDGGGGRLTRQGHVIGTLLYMAPEQVMGADTDALSDIFAFGITFYELLTGRHPFQAEDPRSVFYKITSEDPELIHHLVPDCPETLDHVIRRALQKDRELRYQTLRDLRVDVEPLLIALRKERADTLVADAHGLVGDRNFERALLLLNEAIDLDAANQTARQLRETVQMELRRRLVRPRIEGLLTKADLSLAEGNYNDAVQTLEAALRLDPEDAALHARSREVQQQRDRTRESSRLVTEARADLAQGSLTAAVQKASEAIALNPKSIDARSLLEIAQVEIKKRERHRRLTEKLGQVREFLLLNSFQEALAVMSTLESDERDAPEALEVLERLAAQKAEVERQERLRAELIAARELLDGGQFSDAVQLLQRLRSLFPGEHRVSGLLSYAQQELAASERARAIENLQGEVLKRTEANRFEEAVDLLSSAMAEYPEETRILWLRDTVLLAKSAWQRQQAVEQTVRQCDALADQDKFDEALAALNEMRRKYPDDAVLDGLQRRIETGRAVLGALGAANRLMNEGRPERAVAELEAALTESPHERLRLALANARESLAAKQHAALLEQTDREVRLLLEKHEFDRAFQMLDGASAAFAGHPGLERLQDAALSAKVLWERDEAITAAERAVKALRSEQRLEEAMATVRACQERFPDSAVLARLDADLREERERQHRAEAVGAVLEEAQVLASQGDFVGTVELLRRTSTRFPGDSDVERELVRAEQSLRKWQQDQAINSARHEAQELARVYDFERALGVVDAVAASWPGRPELENLRAEIVAVQAAWRRERDVAAAGKQTLAPCSEGRFDEAFRVAGNALGAFPGEKSLLAAQRAAEEGWEQQKRADSIYRAIQGAEERLAGGEPRKAIELLEGAQARYGTLEAIQSILLRAEQALQAEVRADAIASAVVEANSLLAEGRTGDVLAMLERARSEYGASPELDKALGRAQEAITAQRRDESLGAAVRECERLCNEEKYEEARDAAESALRIHPDAPTLMAVRLSATRRLESQNRAADITECVAQASELIDAGDPVKAAELLKGAMSRLGSDPRIDTGLAGAEAAIAVKQRKEAAAAAVERRVEAMQAAVQGADRMVQDQNPFAAISMLETALGEHGPTAELGRALERAREAERNLNARRECSASLPRTVQQCTDLICAGNLAEAGRILQNAKRDSPDEPEFVALQQTLRDEWDRRRRSEAIRRAADNARALLDQGQPARAVQLLEAAAAQYPDDLVVQDALAQSRRAQGEQRKAEAVESVCRETWAYLDKSDFERALKTVEVNLETLWGEQRLVELRETVIAARRDFERKVPMKPAAAGAQVVDHQESTSAPTRQAEIAAAISYPSPPGRPPYPVHLAELAPRTRLSRWRKIALAVTGCAVALTAALTGIRALRPGAAATTVTVETEPAGAAVTIGKRSCVTPDCRLELPVGNYHVDARLPGYAAASEVVSIGKAESARVRLVLVPLPTSVMVTSNFATGNVYLDEVSVGELRNGQLTLDKLQPGLHRLRIASPDGEALMRFKTRAARLPELNGKITARDTGAIVLTSLGPSVRAACSGCEGTLMLDGKPLEGKAIEVGAHELTARTATGQAQRAFFHTSDAPVIAIHLSSTVSPDGTLVVETNVDGASVSIDRRRLGRQTEAGRLVIPLEPRYYTIEIHKQGYRVTPERLVAKIRKGDQFRAAFRLEPYPGALVLSGAAEGATVLIDGTPAGKVRGGSFSIAVSPGPHTVALAKEGFKTASAARTFEPGETVRLDNVALRLEALPQPPKQPPQPSAEEIEAAEWAAARSGRDRVAIQAFLQKHPGTARRQEAQQLLAQLEWDALDRKDRSALERFGDRYRGTPLAQQAASEIARIDHEAAVAAARTAEEQITAERAEISRVLGVYAAAFERKDLTLLKTVWPNLPEAALGQAFRRSGEIRSRLRPLAPIEFSGDLATVRCMRVTEQVTQFGRQKPIEEARTVRLRRESGRWVISAID